MDNEHINMCMNKLEKTVNNYKNDSCDDIDNNIIKLLSYIIIVEKSTVTPDVIFEQLRDTYFRSELLTANFINKLYLYDSKTLEEYIDICLENIYEDEIDESIINQKLDELKNILSNINPELLIKLDNKKKNYGAML